MTALRQLRELSLTDNRLKHPNMPEQWRCTRNYNDRTANGLTGCIIDYLRFSGHQCERINCTGRPLDQTKVVIDVFGDSRRIGSVKWLPTSGQRGTADISATIRGKSVKIEVKMKDKQSPDQKKYQQQIERAGGKYWICHSLDEFMKYYNELR